MSRSERFLRETREIITQLLVEDDLEGALSGSLEILVRVLGSEAGVVWLLNEKTGRLEPAAHTGPADISGVTIEYGSGIESRVIRTGEAAAVAEVPADESGSVFDGRGFRAKSMLVVPLNDAEKTIGCIQVINKKDGSPYDEDELELCERMAALAAMTIDEKGFSFGETVEREVLLSLRGVTKDYENPGNVVHILKGINLDVYKGELLVVLGESGCGKSTMMNIIGGMTSLTDGELTVEGRDYSHPSEKELTDYRRNTIGFIFQSFNLMPNLTALENVRFIAEISRDPLPAEEALAQVGLQDRADNFPAQMSGGQQQRVAIARALVKRPKLILADEPTAALDYETSIEVLQAIERVVRENQTTVIMITHNPEIGKMADRVVRMRNGKVFSIRRNIRRMEAKELEW